MCSDCDEEAFICPYCGDECYGGCCDPDTCLSCWGDQFDAFSTDHGLEDECADNDCRCNCHSWGEDADFRVQYNPHGSQKKLFERNGVFPFLELPGETRDKIYGYAFAQRGIQRSSVNHRGKIHTALLGTCRQIYKEARHLPLTLNRLCFASPLDALDFIGFTLAPSVKSLFTGLEVEFHFYEGGWVYLLRQLAKMQITHLGLTVKGGYPAESIKGHTCFIDRFAVIKTLKSFNLNLTSYQISKRLNSEIEEELREKLIEGYVAKHEETEQKKSIKVKRPAGEDDAIATKPSKRAKRLFMKVNGVYLLPRQVPRPALKAKSTSKPAHAKQSMLSAHELLTHYATSLDAEATPVKIRLACALKAAKKVNERKFKRLARSILETLEEQSKKIATARTELSNFAQGSALLGNDFDNPSSSRPGISLQSSTKNLQGISTSVTFQGP